MPETLKIFQLMQYSLLLAARSDDYFERALGPIHLLKYAYLADMDYARFNDGKTFSGIDWIFHHFGPWSVVAFTHIDDALTPIGAMKKTFQSDFGDKDCVRWSMEYDEQLFSDLGKELPIEVKHSLQKNVRHFQNDTTLLLHYVYATPPMLNAAPEEVLDFSMMVAKEPEKRSEYIPYLVRLSKDNRQKLKQGMNELRKRYGGEAIRAKTQPEYELGRMDAVFKGGVQWLDALAGNTFPKAKVAVRFSDEVWKSKARSGDA